MCVQQKMAMPKFEDRPKQTGITNRTILVTALPFMRMNLPLLLSLPFIFPFLSYCHTLGFEFSESPNFQ